MGLSITLQAARFDIDVPAMEIWYRLNKDWLCYYYSKTEPDYLSSAKPQSKNIYIST